MSQPHLRVVADGATPPPLLPPEIDLADLREVLLNIQWLCDSRFAFTASPEEYGAAVRLHARSIHERPAATLPDDDAELAFLAGFGRDMAGWRRVKERALEGWTRCADGRLYRRDMAIKALDIWIKTLSMRRKSAAGVARRKKIEFNPEPYDRPLMKAIDALYALDPHAPVLRNYMNAQPEIEPEETPAALTSGDTSGQTPGSTKGKEPKGNESEGYISPTGRSPVGAPGRPEGDSGGGEASPVPVARGSPVPAWPPDAFDRFWEGYDRKVGKLEARAAFEKVMEERPMSFEEFMLCVLKYFVHKPKCNDTIYPERWLSKRRWEDVYPDLPPEVPRRHGTPRSSRPWQPTNYRGRG